MYSQGKEEQFIEEFLKGKTGTVLDIGANDGKTFSNSLRLIELGWKAILVEPSPACVKKIEVLHGERKNLVHICQCAIGLKTETATFHESGQLNDPSLNGAENISLVSTLIPSEKKRWDSLNIPWNEYVVQVFNWYDFLNQIKFKNNNDGFDFISLDAEGVDFDILKQINLHETKTKLICIEFNGNQELKKEILDYVAKFEIDNIIYESGENLLLCKKQ